MSGCWKPGLKKYWFKQLKKFGLADFLFCFKFININATSHALNLVGILNLILLSILKSHRCKSAVEQQKTNSDDQPNQGTI